MLLEKNYTAERALVETRLSAAESDVVTEFRADLEDCMPYFYNLANQINKQNKQWDVLIGDDIGARLVTTFVRGCLQGRGVNAETIFMSGSRVKRVASSMEESRQAAHARLSRFSSPPKALLITENATSYETLRYLREVIEPHVEELDIGVLVSPYGPPEDMDDVMVGAYGTEAAEVAYRTFENVGAQNSPWQNTLNVLRKSKIIRGIVRKVVPLDARAQAVNMPTSTINRLTNTNPEVLMAGRAALDDSIATAPHACYTIMNEMAMDYLDQTLPVRIPELLK